MKGKDITIPEGTQITAYINGDISLDPAKFTQPNTTETGAGTSTQPTASASTTEAAAALSSIEVHPHRMGLRLPSTISTWAYASALRLAAGDHKIRIEKQGFEAWEKTLTVSSGESATVNASLEQQRPAPLQ